MEAWYLPTALVLLALACVVMGLFSTESRPGFAEARTDYKERWFIHSKHD
jgi:succinate dehydrogenase/fumarate reductase flavoprotein subunit